MRHYTAWCAVGIFALAAVAFAQPGREPAADAAADRERQILELIEREQAQNGPHSQALIEPLFELALLSRENGDDAQAFAAIERLLQVVRVNDGLYSLEQVPLIEQLIALEESVGDASAAWDLEQRLLTLARRHPDDLRTVSILRDAAEKRVELAARYEAGEVPPQIEFGCYRGWPRFTAGSGDSPGRSDSPGHCDAGSKRQTSRAIVSDAQRNYAEAIAVLLRNDQYSSAELRALERGLTDTIVREYGVRGSSSLIQVMPHVEPWRSWAEALGDIARIEVPNPTGLPLVPGRPPSNGYFDYLLGRESLVRQFAYELAAPAALSVQIEAFLRIADWDLLHGWNALASGEYEQVYRLLAGHGASESIDDLFSPALPVVLPAHTPNPLATAAAGAYVDVAFEVTQYGESRKIEIRAATANVTAAEMDALVSLIKDSRFRPRSQDGEPARASPVVVRYYIEK